MSLINSTANIPDSLCVFRSSSFSESPPADRKDPDDTIFGLFRNGINRVAVKKGLQSLLVDRSSRQVLYDFVQRHQEFAESSLVLSKVVNKAQELDQEEIGSASDPIRYASAVIPQQLWKTIKAAEKCLLDNEHPDNEPFNLTILLSQIGTIHENDKNSRYGLVQDVGRRQYKNDEYGGLSDEFKKSLRKKVLALFTNYMEHDLIKTKSPSTPHQLDQLVHYLLLMETEKGDYVSGSYRFINKLETGFLRSIAVKYPKLVLDKFFTLSNLETSLESKIRLLVCRAHAKELFVAMFEALGKHDPSRALKIFSEFDYFYEDVFRSNPEHFPAILPHLLELSKKEGGKEVLRAFFNRLGCNGDSTLLDDEITGMDLISLMVQHCGLDNVTSLSKLYGLTESEVLEVMKASIEHLKMEGAGSRFRHNGIPQFDDPILQQEWESFFRDKLTALMRPDDRFVLLSEDGSQEQEELVDNLSIKNLLFVFEVLYEHYTTNPNVRSHKIIVEETGDICVTSE